MFNIDDIKNTIIQGDNVEILKNIPSSSVDFIFADPPYFMQTEGELLRANGNKFEGVEYVLYNNNFIPIDSLKNIY